MTVTDGSSSHQSPFSFLRNLSCLPRARQPPAQEPQPSSAPAKPTPSPAMKTRSKTKIAEVTLSSRLPNIWLFTDIGKDYDDMMALLMLGWAHKHGEIHLVGVITTYEPAGKRAQFARGLLDAMGIFDVPVARGTAATDKPKPAHEFEFGAKFISNQSEDSFENYDTFGKRILEEARAGDVKIRVMSIAPMRDLWTIIESNTKLFLDVVSEVHIQGAYFYYNEKRKEDVQQKETLTLTEEANKADEGAGPPTKKIRTDEKEAGDKGAEESAATRERLLNANMSPLSPTNPEGKEMDKDEWSLVPAKAANNMADIDAARKVYDFVYKKNVNCTVYTKEAAAMSLFTKTTFDIPLSKVQQRMHGVVEYLQDVHEKQNKAYYTATRKPETRFLDYMTREWFIQYRCIEVPKEIAEKDAEWEEMEDYVGVIAYDGVAALGCMHKIDSYADSKVRVPGLEDWRHQYQYDKIGKEEGEKLSSDLRKYLTQALCIK
ncbi:hypothetical protein K491DRAFT_698604 [Lophiostoma macrostomum CBS 122681]|uniref:Inosine/uridine-preferring nucleoside hydrolase domain-containing protein n=1 Tax=Lophiostoma macrostomum CBS 122681 TaxID=1314788 RepID=A0A6A6SPC0_9PLEO|nr:hypothetical protein K491DRAFT_698604 [Lophiostoma macrostomum CBS 122681]